MPISIGGRSQGQGPHCALIAPLDQAGCPVTVTVIVRVRVVCGSNLAESGELGAVLGDSSERSRKRPSGEDPSGVED